MKDVLVALFAVIALLLGFGPLRQVAIDVAAATGPSTRDSIVDLLPQNELSEVVATLASALGPALVAIAVLAAATLLQGVGRVVALFVVAAGVIGLGAAAGSPTGVLVVLPLLGIIGASIAFARFAAAAAAGVLGAGWSMTVGEVSREAGSQLAVVLEFDAAGPFAVAVVATGIALWSGVVALLLHGA